ncbi:MAG: 1,4-dihydroxy-6-naphthoate synthase [Bacteroidales bacterium]|nr:1,4-dihydroxy-6-naphthoate synthase [Bacteroidales bacterium]
MKLSLGFSPCPNDTFIFDALVHNKIDTEGLEFEYFMADVEELNQKAIQNLADVSKVSFHAYLFLRSNYTLLNSGSALGENVGPLLISKRKYSLNEIDGLSIAIPGKLTTANLLLKIAAPKAVNKTEIVFSDIENAVLEDKFDAGLIIHENRFTYLDKGLKKIIDLGEYWKKLTNSPIPLGGIIAKKGLTESTIEKLNRIIKRSVLFAMNNPESSKDFVKQNAQEMADDVIEKHINLYVNNYTIELGDRGKKAINTLIQNAI